MGKLQGELQHMSQQMNEYHGRFGHYISLIVQNEPNVIITNEREMAKMENNSVSSLNQFKI